MIEKQAAAKGLLAHSRKYTAGRDRTKAGIRVEEATSKSSLGRVSWVSRPMQHRPSSTHEEEGSHG